jgi:glyoxylase-like metal-dependent hydrolase (beta-lactamase superfamily II)
MTVTANLETLLPGLDATAPAGLPFAPSLHIRAFVLRRAAGDVAIYSAPGAGPAVLGSPARAYLNHAHDAALGADLPGVPLFVHEADAREVARTRHVRATFSRRHTLDDDLEVIPAPGHTPGASAYLWDAGGQRLLFTGDTIYLRDGEWVAAVLASSDRTRYLESLELIRELDFDVLVPWAASAGDAPYAETSRADARRRVGTILDRVRRGANH